MSSSRNLIKYIVKRPYWTPTTNMNTNKNININTQGFIDYDKYVQYTETMKEKDKQINDIHMYYKHLSNANTEHGKDLKKILCNVSAINQSINDQKYWIFHSVLLSYIGLFTYIFKI